MTIYIAEFLQREGTVWHRTCYSDATNKAMVQRARCHLQEYLSSGTHREPGRMPVKRKCSESIQRARCHLHEYLSSGSHREPGRMPVKRNVLKVLMV